MTPGQLAYPSYNWGSLTGVEGRPTDRIVMPSSRFDPLIAVIPAGVPIDFVNRDALVHTVTVPALGIDERVPSRSAISLTVPEPGRFDYLSGLHPPDMLGRLVVRGATSTQPPDPSDHGAEGSG